MRSPTRTRRFVCPGITPFIREPNIEVIEQSIYDFPEYYDLVYGSDWEAECEFLNGCFEKYADGSVQRLFEPACGTGRLLFRLGMEGFDVSGVDLNAEAVRFCNRRLAENEIEGRAFVGDMTNFTVDGNFDASFNTINSFRHLNSHKAAVAHLQCMAREVRPQGLYVLGIHLTPTDIAPSEEEDWVAGDHNLQVNTRMWLSERDLDERFEKFAIEFEVYTPEGFRRIVDELIFRTYTAAQFQELLTEVESWEVAGVHDFAYNIDQQTNVDGRTEDVVYVLRRV